MAALEPVRADVQEPHILWVTFSSNRDYGLHLKNTANGYPQGVPVGDGSATRFDNYYPPESPTYDQPQPSGTMNVTFDDYAAPQIWMAAIVVDPAPSGDGGTGGGDGGTSGGAGTCCADVVCCPGTGNTRAYSCAQSRNDVGARRSTTRIAPILGIAVVARVVGRSPGRPSRPRLRAGISPRLPLRFRGTLRARLELVAPGSRESEAPNAARASYIRIRVLPPSVMLVRIEPGDEPAELGLEELGVRVLRVRHPIPACQRMRITRPFVVVVGESVREAQRRLLVEEASQIGAALLPLGPLVDRPSLGPWMRGALERVAKRRAGTEAVDPRWACR